MCTKKKYSGKGKAKKALIRVKGKFDEDMHIYFCIKCKKYHIGHDE